MLRRSLVVLAALTVVLPATAPAAFAATSRRPVSVLEQRRNAARQRRAGVLRELNLAKASDTQMSARLAVLERDLHVQRNYADAAVRQAAAATESVRRIRTDIDALQNTVDTKRALITKRAVAAYKAAEVKPFVAITAVSNVTDAARRASFLARLAAADTATIDSLDAARTRLADRHELLSAAEARARARASEADRALADVVRIVNQQRSTRTALQARIRALQSEAAALAAQQASVEALIRSRQGTGRVSRDGRVSGLGFAWPLHGTITSGFGPRWGGFHPGIDIADPRGTPIAASKAGVVIFAGSMSGYGNFVIIDHGGGYATGYAHQSRIACSEGQTVKQGQIIGYVGSTGHSTGNHLHFEVRVDGHPQNPLRFLP
jgi:murein DD-endopeptidase MepM/ murein hydrolase activator NlpD